MTTSFLKNIVKEIDNDYAGLLSEGGVGDIESFVDTGSYIFNALISGSIYKGIPSNKITALAGVVMHWKCLTRITYSEPSFNKIYLKFFFIYIEVL